MNPIGKLRSFISGINDVIESGRSDWDKIYKLKSKYDPSVDFELDIIFMYKFIINMESIYIEVSVNVSTLVNGERISDILHLLANRDNHLILKLNLNNQKEIDDNLYLQLDWFIKSRIGEELETVNFDLKKSGAKVIQPFDSKPCFKLTTDESLPSNPKLVTHLETTYLTLERFKDLRLPRIFPKYEFSWYKGDQSLDGSIKLILNDWELYSNPKMRDLVYRYAGITNGKEDEVSSLVEDNLKKLQSLHDELKEVVLSYGIQSKNKPTVFVLRGKR